MSLPPLSFRLPVNIGGKADPDVVEAIGWHDDAINDLQQAIPYLKSQITALQTASKTTGTGTTTNVSTASQSTVVGTNTIGFVNNQTGVTSYSTQPSDYGALLLLSDASAIAVSLTTGTAIQTPWFFFVFNDGSGTATLTPQSGTINGSSSLALTSSSSAIIFYDGTNFEALTLTSGGGGYTPQGGPTSGRPGSPILYQTYFDTTIGYPVFWSGTAWLNASGFPS